MKKNNNKVREKAKKNITNVEKKEKLRQKKEIKKEKMKKEEEIKKAKKKRKKIIAIILSILVVIASLFFAIFVILKNEENNKYAKKMKVWGFDSLYNNGKTYSWESVSKIEAAKIILAATKNTANLSTLYTSPDNNTSDEEITLYLDNYYKIIEDGKITKENMNEKATLLDVYMLINNSRINILGNNDTRVVEPQFKDYQTYIENEKVYIYAMLSQNFLENSDKKLNGYRNITKKDLNKLVYDYVYKYSTISLDNEKIIDDEEKLPSNADEYPYILESVPKEVYEQKNITEINNEYVYNAAEVFNTRRSYIANTKYNAEQYFNILLNIDYETINADELIEKLNDYIVMMVRESDVKEYVEYVKKNKIKITGKATAQLPAMYNDGTQIRLRTKLEFKVENSETNKNILCFDNIYGDEITYNENEYVLYIDAPLKHVLGSGRVYNDQIPIYKSLLDMSKDKIKIKSESTIYTDMSVKEGATLE